MKISVLGATGRVGQLVVEYSKRYNFEVVCAISSGDSISNLFRESEVIVDFSHQEATAEMLVMAKDRRSITPIVIGTTGLQGRHENLMSECSRMAPIFHSPNMSVVVAILNEMVKDVAGILGGDEFDVEILEEHHKKKKDAPSGTALMLGKTIAEARKRTFSEVARFDRFNDVAQPRVEGEIGFAALRGGSTVGMHEVSFNGVFEKLTLRHDACDVGIFADGALRIARWLKDKKMPPGIYTMHDYLQSFMSKL